MNNINIWFETRLESFIDWPHEKPSEQQVAEAGFKHVEGRDKVECIACGVRLNNWEPHDEPWEEHRKFSPSCPYIRMVKGVSRSGYKYEFKGRLNGEISTIVTNPKIFSDFQSCKEAARKHSFDVPCCMGVFLWVYKLNINGEVISSYDVDDMNRKNKEKSFIEQVQFTMNKR